MQLFIHTYCIFDVKHADCRTCREHSQNMSNTMSSILLMHSQNIGQINEFSSMVLMHSMNQPGSLNGSKQKVYRRTMAGRQKCTGRQICE